MRILQYMSHMRTELGGPIRAVLDLAAALSARGHQVTLASDVDRDVPQAWKDQTTSWPRAVSVPQLAAQRFGGSRGRALEHLVREADVVHMHEVWSLTNARLGRTCRRIGTPYVASVHGALDDWCMTQSALRKRVYLALLGRRHLEGAAAVHTTARFEKEQASKHFPKGYAALVPYLLDLSPFDALPGPEAARATFPQFATGKPVVLFLSRVHVKKGIEHLLRAAALLRDKGAAPQFIIAGPGEESYVQQLKRMNQELRLEEHVHFVGLVVGKEKISLYEAADLFVLPTSQENFGLVFAESLACRTPVIATKGVDIWPELESSGGAVVSSTEPQELAGHIERLLSDPARLEAMGEAGRRWVYKDLNPARVIQQHEEMYQECIDRAGGHSGGRAADRRGGHSLQHAASAANGRA